MRLTIRDLKLIKELWARGLTVREISTTVGRGFGSVQGIVRRQQLTGEIAARPSPMGKRKGPLPLTEIDHKVMALREQGMTQREMGARLGMSTAAVKQRIQKMLRYGVLGHVEAEHYSRVNKRTAHRMWFFRSPEERRLMLAAANAANAARRNKGESVNGAGEE